MTMERWSVHRYQFPQLDVQSIRRLDDAVEVNSRRGVFRLIRDGVANLDHQLLPMLDSLRDPRSALWGAVRDEAAGAAELLPMLHVLDDLGLIRDCGAADASRAHAAIVRDVRGWAAELGADLARGTEHAILAVEQLADRFGDTATQWGAMIDERNFFTVTLLLQARYLRTDAPAMLALVIAGLRAAVRRARLGDDSTWWFGIGDMPAFADDDWSCGLLDLPVVQSYLRALGRLVRDAVGPGAMRRVRSQHQPVESLSGINFMLDLEADIPQLLAELGPSPAFGVVDDRGLARRAIKMGFLQEYLITCRFAECLSPLLSRRFSDPLCDAVHRYFDEETGHETFEREYCIRLGFTEQEVDDAEPLPRGLAFADILTTLARESPISVFCASPFIEGVFSTRHTLATLAARVAPDEPLLVDAIGDRVQSDEGPNCRWIGRDWMSCVPRVTARVQRETSELIAYLAELNWRRWEQLMTVATANPYTAVDSGRSAGLHSGRVTG